MDHRYESYCAADPLFYDSIGRPGRGTEFAAVGQALPAGWRRADQDDWVVCRPPEHVERLLPAQGWKIHVSACLDNATRIIDRCRDYCLGAGLEFKFLRSRAALLMRNSKYAERGGSGKLVTIYPPDDAACARVLAELDALVGGEPGPYILSDLRFDAGPLYVRYGGFALRQCADQRGELVPAITDADGNLVPDRRGPVFALPEWLELPDFLAPALAARNAVTIAELPYRIEEVLHFSNGGGLYRATDRRTGKAVVLKEARPYAGLDAAGDDALARLGREERMLTRLAGIDGIPAIAGRITVGEHQFLVEEYVDGTPLNAELTARLPLTRLDAGPADFAGYADWALHVYREVERVVTAVNDRGIVYGDLNLFNVMVRDDGTIRLLDFEVAAEVGEDRPPTLRSPEFAAPGDRTGTGVDRYALACLRLALFLPLTSLLRLDPAKADHLAAVIAGYFPLPDGFLADAVAVIRGPRPPRRADPRTDDWPAVRDRLVRAILASATPDRDDRLFPGDIEQFRPGGGLGLAHGAAGVLYALSATGAGRYPEHERWLLARATTPPHGTGLGLYDGLHGVAYLLDEFGYRDAALDVVHLCLSERWERLGTDLYGGLAGIGLNLLHLATRTGEAALRVAGLHAAEMAAHRLGSAESVPETSGGRHPHAGLLHGSSGVALLFLRAHDMTGDDRYLDHAATAIEQDLRRCVLRSDGSLAVNEGWRTMPYLADGSAGIGQAIDAYLRYRPSDRFEQARTAILGAARSPLYVQSGLFAGRAGIVYHLATSAVPSTAELAAQSEALAWHAVAYRNGLAFPGEQLLRLSMDLATGTAGVLLALGAAAGHGTLPLLSAPQLPRIQRGSAPVSSIPYGR